MKKSRLPFYLTVGMLCATSCVDKDYDLSDIDTNSRFNVSGLTIPLNLDPVKLDLMLDLKDESDIKLDEDGNYYFYKTGSFSSNPIEIAKITLRKPSVEVNGEISVNISLDEEKKAKMQRYASDITIGELRHNKELMQLIGINDGTEFLNINFEKAKVRNELKLTANDIDPNVQSFDSLGFSESTLSIKLNIYGAEKAIDQFNINNLRVELPHGLVATTPAGTSYNPATGILVADGECLHIGENFRTEIELKMRGINFHQLEEPGMKVFDPDKHSFDYRKECKATGYSSLKLADMKATAKYTDIVALENPDAVSYECYATFDQDLSVTSFRGDITYSMDDVEMDPVSIGHIPELLQEAGSDIELINPQIYLDLGNNLNTYGVGLSTSLEIKGNTTVTAPFAIDPAPWTRILMAPHEENLYNATDYKFQQLSELKSILGSKHGEAFPEELNIRLIAPCIARTSLKEDFPLGVKKDGLEGTWQFYTRLSLTSDAKIKYTRDWDDWQSKDLDGLTIQRATARLTIEKDVALDAESIEFILLGKKGKLRGATAIMSDARQDITIALSNGPVSEIYGAKLNIHLKGKGKDLNKNQKILISKLKVTVDGYYDREL